MAHNVKLWMVSKGNILNEMHRKKLDFESRLEDWIEQDISILSDDYLVIGRQVPTDYDTFIDLLCIDRNGDLVIIELKRDRTPRETVAQVLDYASWVRNLSRDDVISIANSYLKEKGPLENAFFQKFQENLPDVLNASHSMLVVASDIDASTDRIVHYLSETRGVGINIAEFQYFRENNQAEYISRVFHIDPETVASNTKRGTDSKRKRSLTREELEEIAKQNGVNEIYSTLVENVKDYFESSRTTRSSIGFEGKNIGEIGKGVIFNLIPSKSNSETGLKFQVYSNRFSQYFNCTKEELINILPKNIHDWVYESSDGSEDWVGYEGYFKTDEEVDTFLEGFRNLGDREE